jgi:hypothetical protein
MIRYATAVSAVLLLAPVPLAAQRPSAEPWFRAGTWLVTVEVGGAAFTDFQRTTARPAAGLDDQVPVFHRRVSAGTTGTVGASSTWWVGDGWGVRAAGSFAPTRFTVWNQGPGQRALEDDDAPVYARLHVWTASVTAMVRLPLRTGRPIPYAFVGGGVLQHRLTDTAEVPPEARARFARGSWTGPAAVFGVGSTLPLERGNLLLTFELSNHLTRTPLNDEGQGEWFELGGVPLQLERDPARGTDGIDRTSNLRLTVGLSLPLR